MFEKPEYTDALKGALGLNSAASGDFPDLPQGEVHIWTLYIHRVKEQFFALKTLLSERERNRISFFKFERTQNSYIATQATLRVLLSLYLGVNPGEVLLGVQKKGKPFLMNKPPVSFNISNSDDLCVFAFTMDGEVGIDVERVREMPDLDQLIQKNLTSREKDYVLKDPEKKLSRFFRFWTYKESYLKAIGEGMRLTPDNLEFAVEEGKIRLRSVNYGFEAKNWQFMEFTRQGGYTGTLSYPGTGLKVREMMPV